MGAVYLPVAVGMDPCHEFPICGGPKVEGRSSTGGEEVIHVLPRPSVLPVCPGLNVCSSKLPCLDSFWTEDLSVDLFERVPLVVGPLRVEGVCRCAMIEPSASGVGASLLLLSSIGLCGAVTGVGLIRPLPEWDRRDPVSSRGREGYCVSPKRGERVWGAGVIRG